MIILRAYKTRLKPTRAQAQAFARCCGATRFVYNRALALRKEVYEETGETLRAMGLNKELTKWKQGDAPWLYELPNCALQEAFRDLDAAFQHFFRRVKNGGEKPGFPRFKKRGRDPGHFTLRGSIKVERHRVKLPWAKGAGLGWVRLWEKGYLPTNGVAIRTATVSERAGRWFVSLQVEEEVAEETATAGCVGVDVGITTLATVSDGRRFDNPKALRRLGAKLGRLQKEFSRRLVRGKPLSKNAEKTKAKIAKLHYRIANIRQHAAHTASAGIVGRDRPPDERPARVGVESLNVKGMMQNRRLAKALGDAAMSELLRQVAYKSEWFGSEVVEAGTFFPSSKTCSTCGAVNGELTLTDRKWRCDGCGTVHDRDLNAAINLQHVAENPPETLNACGGARKSGGNAGDAPVKQESHVGMASAVTPESPRVSGGVRECATA